MLEYILKTSICWLAFYAVYYAFLRKETFFKINRVYLLTTLCLGAAIPLMENLITIAPTETIAVYIAPLNLDLINDQFAVVASSPVQSGLTVDWMSILFGVYVAGLLIALCRFLYGLYKIYSLYEQAELKNHGLFRLVSTKEIHLPFSFFNMLFISQAYEITEEDKEKIILHEKAHIKGGHSFDVILIELLAIIYWCSPLIYLYKKSIKTVHEYLADEKVLQTTSTQTYGHLLLSHSQAGMQVAMANHFIHSQLKQRIIMMTRNKSTRKNLIKYVLMLPVLLMLVLAFAQSDINHVESKNAIPQQTTEVNLADKIFSEPEDFKNFISTVNESKNNTSLAGVATSRDTNNMDTSRVFKVVEQMPRFPGCEEEKDRVEMCAMEKLLEFVYDNVEYPKEAQKSNIQGTAIVRFVVGKKGEIKDAKVVRDIGGGCGEESLRIVNMMPNFIPGRENGEKVDVQFNLPIKFKLQHESETEEDISETKTIVKPPAAIIKDKEDLTVSDVYKVVEQMPRFPGCENEEKRRRDDCAAEKMLEFIYENVKYPKQAQKEGLEGTAVIRFIVSATGEVVNATIVRDIGGGCGEESLRVVESMPDWIPGMQNGKNVDVQYHLPIKFKRTEEEAQASIQYNEDGNIIRGFVEHSGIPFVFPGCEEVEDAKYVSSCTFENMEKFIYGNLKYPKEAIDKRLKGEVKVKFGFDKSGNVVNAQIVESLGGGCDEEALRVINMMPQWAINKLAKGDVDNRIEITTPIEFRPGSN